MTKFITQNPWLAVTAAFILGLAARIILMRIVGTGKREDCVAMRKAANREQTRIIKLAEQDWAEQTGVEPKCPCGAWEVCEACNSGKKPHQSH